MDKSISKIQINGELYQIKDAEAREVAEQVESHNFGENNQVNAELVALFGDNNVIGAKGFNIVGYMANSVTNRTGFRVEIADTEISDAVQNQPVSVIIDGSSTARFANVVSYTPNGDGTADIIVDKYWLEQSFNPANSGQDYYNGDAVANNGQWITNLKDNDNFLIFPNLPEIGNKVLAGMNTAIGSDNNALLQGSIAIGYQNSAEGKWATALGRGNKAGYAALTSGRGNNALGAYAVALGNGNNATGDMTFASGWGNTASAESAHAQGRDNIASGKQSIARGKNSQALGENSIAEGESAIATGYTAIASGYGVRAEGDQSHAEGYMTKTTGHAAHAEGGNTEASGSKAHAEGENSKATNWATHAEGLNTQANGMTSHAEGSDTVTEGYSAHAEGTQSKAIADQSHAEGLSTEAHGQASHTQNISTAAIGRGSSAAGVHTIAGYEGQFVVGKYNSNKANTLFEVGNGNDNSRANAFEIRNDGTAYSQEGKLATEGYVLEHRGVGKKGNVNSAEVFNDHSESQATADYSHAEGAGTKAEGYAAHAEGTNVTASGAHSHAEGLGTKTAQAHSHAEGYHSQATGLTSHAEGDSTVASGAVSHTQNAYTKAKGYASSAAGYGTVAGFDDQFVIGVYNDNKEDNIFEVGIGVNENSKENGFEVKKDGTVYSKEGKLATETHVQDKIDELVGGAPGALDTLNELAEALQNQEDVAAEIVNTLATKVDKVEGKQLSTNDFTNEDKQRLDISSNMVESHNFGENNTLNKETVGIFGNNNILGCKGYTILKYKVDKLNDKTYVQVDGNEKISTIPVGTPVTLIFDQTATRLGNTVSAISYVGNATEIIINKAWVETNYTNTNVTNDWVDVITGEDYDNLLIFPTYPSIGTTIYGESTFAVGNGNKSLMLNSVSLGKDNSSEGKYSVALGRENIAGGYASLTSGRNNRALGNYSAAIGQGNKATNLHSIALGWSNDASGYSAVAEGQHTTASGDYSHSEGLNTRAIGVVAHAEGEGTVASGNQSHAGGLNNAVSGQASVVYGQDNDVQVSRSIATGYRNKITGGSNIYIGGQDSEVSRANNIAHGNGLMAKNHYAKAVFGSYNEDLSDTHLEVGIAYVGTKDANGNQLRRNGFTVHHDGHAEVFKVGTSDKSVTTKKYVDEKIANLVDSAPDELNTLKELAEALNDQSDIASEVVKTLANKVDKVEGKGLSTNDFTNEYKNTLDSGIVTSGDNIPMEIITSATQPTPVAGKTIIWIDISQLS